MVGGTANFTYEVNITGVFLENEKSDNFFCFFVSGKRMEIFRNNLTTKSPHLIHVFNYQIFKKLGVVIVSR